MPMVAVGDVFVGTKLTPSSVAVALPVKGAFPGEVVVMTGESNVSSEAPVPTCEYSVVCRYAGPYVADTTWQLTADELVQAVVAQLLLSTATVGVKSLNPKFKPETVTVAPPVFGTFQRVLRVRDGASKVNAYGAVPTTRATVKLGDAANEAPAVAKAEPWQTTVLAVDHVEVRQRSAAAAFAKATVSVTSRLAKPSPKSVTEAPPETPALNGARLVETGASYEKLAATAPYVTPWMLVPTRAATVRSTAWSRPTPGVPKHTTRVLANQTVVEHCVPNCPSRMLVVTSTTPKFVPSIVRLPPPLDGALSSWKLLRTGAS